MSKYKKIIIFAAILFLSNLFLFRSGYWFAQDTSYWPKNPQESLVMVIQQFRAFSNFGYYLGFDQGLFNFTRVVLFGIVAFFSNIFGFELSQTAFSLFGYTVTFISFYLFTGIFFKDKNARFALSLLYTFNPLSFTLQGFVLHNASIPLFLYSYYQYFYGDKQIRIVYLLVNILSSFIWISYIRFFQSNFIVIVPYLIYFFLKFNRRIPFKKAIIFIFSYLLLFSPIVYSVVAQLLERSQTAFNYGTVLGRFVIKTQFVNAFNPFQAVAPHFYDGNGWIIAGLLFFCFFLFLVITQKQYKVTPFYQINFFLVLLAITIFGMGNIFPAYLYLSFIKFLPFVTNEPFWAFYVFNLPFVILLGILTESRAKPLYGYVFVFILFAILPLLNLTSYDLKKFNISQIPKPYEEYFVKSYDGLPESTYYFLGTCWRARYMDEEDIPTLCPNFGLKYSSATLSDPRWVSGQRYKLSQTLTQSTDVNNLRVTHNLKNIILPKDAIDKDDDQKTVKARSAFDNNFILISSENDNFIHYYFKDKDLYNFFLYSPLQITNERDISSIKDNKLSVNGRPVVLNPISYNSSKNLQSVEIDYKVSPINPTKYYMHLKSLKNTDPFIIQFNQDYHNSWKLKLITKQDFENIKCISKQQTFSITNNSLCVYMDSFLDLGDIGLLSKPQVEKAEHIESNYVNNGWIVNPKAQNDIYAVLIFEKQIFYIFTVFAAVLTFTFIVLLAIIQEARFRKKTN